MATLSIHAIHLCWIFFFKLGECFVVTHKARITEKVQNDSKGNC